MESEVLISVSVCFSGEARQCAEVLLKVKLGSRLVDAVRDSALLSALSDLEIDALQTSIWGRKMSPEHILREGDRVELCRPLKVDPMVARRERFTRQGARTAGLFSKRRAGAKSGY